MREVVITIVIAAGLVALIFGGAILHWGWTSATPQRTDLVAIEQRPVVPYAVLPEARRFHGVAIQLHNNDLLDSFKQSIREIAQTGADTLLLSTAAYQDNASSSVIKIDIRKAPNYQQMLDLLHLARSLNMRVIVMPIVLLENPRGSEWRGRIVPADPDRWWADYREYLKYYARCAAEGGAELLMVGSELNKMEPSVDRWRDLIKFLRGPDFKGIKLGYSANWDRYWKVMFWDDLDFAGVTTYYTLADHEDPTPTVEEIAATWKPHMEKLVAWQRTVGRPVIFTEVGWYSRKGVATRPWDYYYNQGKPSPEEQANLYEAFLKVWTDMGTQTPMRQYGNRTPADIVGGIIFWEWTMGDGGLADEGYTPEGKPAEKIMRDYFATRPRPATQPATAND